MASAPFESSVGGHEVTAAATLLRDEDPLSNALRLGHLIDVDDITRIRRAMSTRRESSDTIPTTGSSSKPKCSSHEGSTATKPTSAASYPAVVRKDSGEHKMRTGYASSLSAAYGSASEAEMEHTALRRNNLTALGHWADADLETTPPLKGRVRAKDRRQTRYRLKQKKPVVVIEQEVRPTEGTVVESPEQHAFTLSTVPSYGSIGAKSVRTHPTIEASSFTEEGIASRSNEAQPLTHARKHTVGALIVLKVFILIIAAYGAYLTGEKRLPCTKGILFAATSSMAILTVLTMLVAKRALTEALLAGLIEFVFGFALVVEIDDFM